MLVDFLLNLKALITSSAERTGAALVGLAGRGLTLRLTAGARAVFAVFAAVVVFAVVVVLVLLVVVMV
jgi:hypothetical protein